MHASHARPGVRRSRSNIEGLLRISATMREWAGAMIDVSLSGLRAARPQQFALAPGQVCELELDFGIPPRLRSRAHLVRVADGEVAFRFEPLSPNTESELRRILETRGTLRDDPWG